MQTVKMVVTGPFSAGKTQFIQSVSEIDAYQGKRGGPLSKSRERFGNGAEVKAVTACREAATWHGMLRSDKMSGHARIFGPRAGSLVASPPE